MAGGKRFAGDFQRIDAVKPNDKMLIQDSEDGNVKFAFPGQFTAINGYKTVESVEELPLNPMRKNIAYVVGDDMYFWVGTGGDTLGGVYQKANIFKGEKGEAGEAGRDGAMRKVMQTQEDIEVTLLPNRMYIWEKPITELALTFASADEDIVPIYAVQFETGSRAPQINIDNILWGGISTQKPTFEANSIYVLWFINGIGYINRTDIPFVTLRCIYNASNAGEYPIINSTVPLTAIYAMRINGNNVKVGYMQNLDRETIIEIDIAPRISKEAFYQIDNLTALSATKGTPIIENGTDFFFDCDALTTLDLSGWDVSNVTSMNSMFAYLSGVATLNVSSWDVSNVASMRSMFYECNSLTSLDVSGWNTSSLTDMRNIFYNCEAIPSLNVSGWNVSGVSDLRYIFYNCKALTSLDLSGWDVTNATTLDFAFYNCNALTTIGVSGWDVSNVTSMNSMFFECASLTSLDLSTWDVSNVTNMKQMFYNATNLASLKMAASSIQSNVIVTNMFNGVTAEGVFSYNPAYDYSRIINVLPASWTSQPWTEE